MNESGKTDITTRELLASWDRHTRILSNLCTRIGAEERNLKASEDGSTLVGYLCHIHECRHEWLGTISPTHAALFGDVLERKGDAWTPISDLYEIKRQLNVSGQAVVDAVRDLIDAGKSQVGPYDHPVYFLQHMLWHESGHFAIMMLALRLAGKEPDEQWEEDNVWGIWRS